jgi:16S rRNA (guanine527-N7)-methyltransferase
VGILEDARGLGFIGPGPVERQVVHGRAFARVIEDWLGDASPLTLLDLGAGGGLPGLVIALVREDARLSLLDASLRRTRFLEEAVRKLDLENRIRVVRGRAEEVGRQPELREAFPVVVARGFGPPAVTAECASPLLALGGTLVVSEPPPAASGLEDGDSSDLSAPRRPGGLVAPRRAEALGGSRWPADHVGILGLAPEVGVRCHGFSFQVLTKMGTCPQGFPRRSGTPAKRPLF